MIKTLLSKELRNIADKIDAGTCEVSQDDALEIMSVISNVSLSREESARYLNMNASTFRKKVEAGKIAKPHKRRGLVEKLWFLHELKHAIFR